MPATASRPRTSSVRGRPTQRFERPARALVVAALGTPVVATVGFCLTYWLASSTMPPALMGDNFFAWVLYVYGLFVAPIWLIVALQFAWALAWPTAPNAFRAGALLTLIGCLAGVIFTFAYVPSWSVNGSGFRSGSPSCPLPRLQPPSAWSPQRAWYWF